MVKTRLYIPNYYYKDVLSIDYELMKSQGITTLFFDLDNTLIDYDTSLIPNELMSFLKDLEKDFKIIILSNNSKKRVSRAVDGNFKFVSRAFKPLKRGFIKAIKLSGNKREEILMIGDQLMTDVKGSNKVGIKVCLVNPLLRRSDAWTTKINRFFEKRVVNKLKKHYPEIYEERIKPYYES